MLDYLVIFLGILVGFYLFSKDDPKGFALRAGGFFAGYWVGSTWLSVIVSWAINLLNGILKLLEFSAENQTAFSGILVSLTALIGMAWLFAKIDVKNLGVLVVWGLLGMSAHLAVFMYELIV